MNIQFNRAVPGYRSSAVLSGCLGKTPAPTCLWLDHQLPCAAKNRGIVPPFLKARVPLPFAQSTSLSQLRWRHSPILDTVCLTQCMQTQSLHFPVSFFGLLWGPGTITITWKCSIYSQTGAWLYHLIPLSVHHDNRQHCVTTNKLSCSAPYYWAAQQQSDTNAYLVPFSFEHSLSFVQTNNHTLYWHLARVNDTKHVL